MKRPLLAERLEAIPPSGIRVIFDKVQNMKDVVRFEVGEPDFDTPIHIKEAAKRALDEGSTHYTASAGLIDLREAIAAKMKRENSLDVDPRSEVVVTSGACSAVFLTFTSILNSGDEVLIPDPCWPHYEPCITLANGKAVRYPLYEKNNFEPSTEDIERLITQRTKAILINFPANPTGGIASRKVLEQIASTAIKDDILVISDEVYEKILYNSEQFTSVASLSGMSERTITINALSKTYAMTGWRVGYAVAPSQIIKQLVKLNLYSNTCANSIAQKAGIAALSGPQHSVSMMVAEYKKRRDIMVKRLNEIDGFRCANPKGAFYVFPNIEGTGLSSFDCSMNLLDEGRVSTVPGNAFGKLGEGHLRLSYAVSPDKIDEGMGRISSTIERRKHKLIASS